jgi:hypothetical protein
MYKRNTMAVRITNVIVENQEVYVFRVCVCGLIYPACKAHAPYYLSSAACLPLLHFSTLSHKGHDFQENNFECKICLALFTTFVRNISPSKNNSSRYHNCTLVFI